jgi:hypothetical protein
MDRAETTSYCQNGFVRCSTQHLAEPKDVLLPTDGTSAATAQETVDFGMPPLFGQLLGQAPQLARRDDTWRGITRNNTQCVPALLGCGHSDKVSKNGQSSLGMRRTRSFACRSQSTAPQLLAIGGQAR